MFKKKFNAHRYFQPPISSLRLLADLKKMSTQFHIFSYAYRLLYKKKLSLSILTQLTSPCILQSIFYFSLFSLVTENGTKAWRGDRKPESLDKKGQTVCLCFLS